MKKLTLVILSCLVITGCSKKNLDVVSNSDMSCQMPIVNDYYPNGKKKSEYHCQNGKQHGLTTKWFENGQKELEIPFKYGKMDGLATNWYENGQKEFEVIYEDGRTVKQLITYGERISENKKDAEKPKHEVTPIISDAKEIEKEHVQISDSGFEKEITFMGLVKTYKTNEGLERFEQAMERAGHKITYPNNYYFIRSWLIKNTGAVIHQLYVSCGYTGFDNKYVDWYSANDENANTLNVVSISKNIAVDSSMIPYKFIEIVGVELSNELLKANKNTGFRVKLKSKKSTNSDRVISVTAEQVAAQLDAVETKRKEMFPNDKTPNIKNKRGAK